MSNLIDRLPVADNPPDDLARRLTYVKEQIESLFAGNLEFAHKLYEYVTEWVNYLVSREKSENTITTYLTHVLYLFRFLSQNNLGIEVSNPDAERFVMSLPKSRSSTTRNIALYAARSFYKFLVRFDHLAKTPFDYIEGVRQRRRLPRPLKAEDYDAIYDVIIQMRGEPELSINRRFLDAHELLPFLFLMNTGLRSMEMMSIKGDSFKRDEKGNLEVRVRGKGRYERRTYIVDVYGRFAEFAKEIGIEPDIQLFFWKSLNLGVQTSSRRVVFEGCSRHVLYDLLRAVNSWPKKSGKGEETQWTLHQFRHTYATFLLENGMPIEEIMIILGHKSINTTLIYAKVSDTSISRNIALLNRVRLEPEE